VSVIAQKANGHLTRRSQPSTLLRNAYRGIDLKGFDLAPGIVGAARGVATRSILNPLLWLTLIVTPTASAATLFAPGSLVTLFAILAIAPPGLALLAYVYFMFADPDRLQSEPFRIEQQWVQAQIGDNRTQEVITVPVERSAPTANSAIEAQSDG